MQERKDLMLQAALNYIRNQVSVIPLTYLTKRPALREWATYQNRIPTMDEVQAWFSESLHNIAIVCGRVSNLIVVDVDDREKFEKFVLKLHAKAPANLLWVKTRRGVHLYFRYPAALPEDVTKIDLTETHGMELRANRCYVVAPPSVVAFVEENDDYVAVESPADPRLATHKVLYSQYQFFSGVEKKQIEFSAELLPEIPEWLLEPFLQKLQKNEANSKVYSLGAAANSKTDDVVINAIAELVLPFWQEGQRHNLSLYLAGYLRKVGWDWESVEKLLLTIAERAGDEELRDRIRALSDTFAKQSLEEIAGASRLREIMPEDIFNRLRALVGDEPELTSSDELQTTVLMLARKLAEAFQDRFVFIEKLGWHQFDGKRWVECRQEEVVTAAMDYLSTHFLKLAKDAPVERRRFYIDCAKICLNRHKIVSVVETLSTLLKAYPDEFDADPYLLNCQNGVINLQTGELMPHSPKFKITKIVNAEYNPDSDISTWLKFLDDIFLGDKELIAYIQRCFGYALTGDTSEQVFWVCWGTGANGKSTLFNFLRNLLNDYATTIPTDAVLTRRNGDAHPTKLASLKGVRLGVLIETEEEKVLASSLVKAISAGDTITARKLYHDYFEFAPTVKLFIITNHKPQINDTTIALWRRLRFVPFRAFFPPERQDKRLSEKLWAERHGILAWLVRGCLDWQQLGDLKTPEVVVEATKQYRLEVDILQEWLEQRCVPDPKAVTLIADLYEDYKAWCEERDETPVSKRKFSQQLSEKGYETVVATHNKKAKRGLRLRNDNDNDTSLFSPDDDNGGNEPVNDDGERKEFSQINSFEPESGNEEPESEKTNRCCTPDLAPEEKEFNQVNRSDLQLSTLSPPPEELGFPF